MRDRDFFLLDLRQKPELTTDCSPRFTKLGAELMVWWAPNHKGYGNSLVHPWVGRYTEAQVREHAAYYQLGKLTLALPCEVVLRFAVPCPDRFGGTVGSRWCDGPGPIVINHSLMWDLLEPHAWMPEVPHA